MEINSEKPTRLHYLDWLRVILILGVFLYHALHPFDAMLDWHIKNDELSEAILSILLLVSPWGIPLFFLVSGAGSKFALKRRSNKQYISERTNRLFIPFIIGAIIFTPLQKYLEVLNKGTYQGSFTEYIPEFISSMTSGNLLSVQTFARWGLHLWFLGYLFSYSLLALLIFRWFEGSAGKSFVNWLARFSEKRGGLFLFIIPLTISRILVQPFAPEEHSWLDFVYSFLFFVFGYILYSDDRFLKALRRDRWLLFWGGLLSLVAFFGMFIIVGDEAFDWFLTFVMPWSILMNFVYTIISWSWALFVLSLVMTGMNYSNKWLEYGKGTIMPFYLIHQPVIVVIAFFVVQWDLGLLPKLLIVVTSSLLISFGLVEILVRPFKPIRKLFGMKARNR
jgi:glucan biosynthesis protein C